MKNEPLGSGAQCECVRVVCACVRGLALVIHMDVEKVSCGAFFAASNVTLARDARVGSSPEAPLGYADEREQRQTIA